MHRATVFNFLLLGETDGGRDLRINQQRYAERQHRKQKKFRVLVFHI
jgi:hypothetical protein